MDLDIAIAFGSYILLFVFSYFSFTEYLFRNYENSKSVTFTFVALLGVTPLWYALAGVYSL